MGTSSLKPWGDTWEKVPPANQVPKTAAAHPRYPQGTGAAQQLLGWAKPPLALTQTMGGLGQPPSSAPASTKFSSGPSWPLEHFVYALAAPSPISQTCREHSPLQLLACSSCTSTWPRAPALHPGYKRSPRTFPPPLLEPGEIFIKSTSSLYRFCSLCKQQSLFLSPAVLKSSGLPLNNDLR